jgi:hypothetical protein
MADITTKMAEALRLAHDHIEMDKLLVSHPRDWALIKDALAYEAEAKPAPAPLTNADVVEAWRTTEARRDDYGWTSCEWFQEGVRFAQRHYRVGAAAPAALAALEAEAKPAPAEPVGWALVPVEPTADMRNAYHAVTHGDAVIMGESGARWAAMLAAAPAAPAGKAQPLNIDIDRGRVWIKRGNQSFMMAYEGDEDELQWYCDRLKEALSGITPDVKTAPAAPALHPDERADLAERIEAAHEASLDDDHRACQSILKECLKMLAFPNAAPMTGPKPAFWVYEWLHPADGSVTLRSLRPEDHCCKPDRAIPVPLMDEWVQWAKAAAPADTAAEIQRLRDELALCCELKRDYQKQALAAPAALAPQLPPMPEPHWPRYYQGSVPPGAYTADQMQAYARAAIDAAPAAPAPHPDAKDAERWRTFIGLPYEIRAEWAVNLSLTPTLISWVDSATKEQA